jgi:hypothetical protein
LSAEGFYRRPGSALPNRRAIQHECRVTSHTGAGRLLKLCR